MTRFEQEFGNRKIGFLVRKFEARPDREKLINTVRETFKSRGYTIKDAGEHILHPETWGNIKEFMDNCAFGVVVIDNLSATTGGFNPNVFLEIGYLMALKKQIFILIQNSLADTLPTDIKPILYTSFDSLDVESPKLRFEINKWIDNTISYNPGYLNLYFKGEFINMEAISEFKDIVFSISDCCIIDHGTVSHADEAEKATLKIVHQGALTKIVFKTQTKAMTEQFVADFECGRYDGISHIKESIIHVKANSLKVTEDHVDGGINFIFNHDKESLIYCENKAIEDCDEEAQFAIDRFKLKKTNDPKKIEIMVLPKFNKPNTFLYVSNFLRHPDRFIVKICHYTNVNGRIVLPLTAVDMLYMIVYRDMVPYDKIKSHSDYRKQYLEVVDMHVDQVSYTVENRIPAEMGIAQNVKYFDLKN